MNEEQPMPAHTSPFYQVGIIVPDLEPAMEELGATLGLTWGTVVEAPYEPAPIRFVFSVQGPPHVELIEGPDGGPWSSAGGPRIDHIGFWSPDVQAGKRELEQRGLPIDVDGETLGNPIFSYHRAESCGMRVELVSDALRERFYASLGRDVP
jgi:glyoxalase/bleomycin resistance protein/dioxygenase superfamily protein